MLSSHVCTKPTARIIAIFNVVATRRPSSSISTTDGFSRRVSSKPHQELSAMREHLVFLFCLFCFSRFFRLRALKRRTNSRRLARTEIKLKLDLVLWWSDPQDEEELVRTQGYGEGRDGEGWGSNGL